MRGMRTLDPFGAFKPATYLSADRLTMATPNILRPTKLSPYAFVYTAIFRVGLSERTCFFSLYYGEATAWNLGQAFWLTVETAGQFKEYSMLVTFTTDAYADITMFGDVALAMLKMMGHSTTVPGAILAADVPAALSRLTAAIEAEKAAPPVEDKDADEPVVSLAHRALPLIDLLAAAAKAESNVMWK